MPTSLVIYPLCLSLTPLTSNLNQWVENLKKKKVFGLLSRYQIVFSLKDYINIRDIQRRETKQDSLDGFKIYYSKTERLAFESLKRKNRQSNLQQAGIWDIEESPPCLCCYLWHSLLRPKHDISGDLSTWRNLCNCLPDRLQSTPHTTGVS